MSRPSWELWAIGIARAVAERADCRRRQVGSVLFRPDWTVASVGMNGHERGGKSCLAGECPRGLVSYEICPPGSSYDQTDPAFRCDSLHSEQNCILNANESTVGYTLVITSAPCSGCLRVIRAARLARVIWADGDSYQEMSL